MNCMNRQEVFLQIQQALVELFEIKEEDISLDTHIYHELDLDSIDAVDLIVHLQRTTGKKIRPDQFKGARTIEHIITAVVDLPKAS